MRAAVNHPIQGTQADIIKVAMIRVQQLLEERGSRARMLLQVHDELLVEAPHGDAHEMASLLQHIMSAASNLSVPTSVDVGIAKSWALAH